jgi:hypothetical protein
MNIRLPSAALEHDDAVRRHPAGRSSVHNL